MINSAIAKVFWLVCGVCLLSCLIQGFPTFAQATSSGASNQLPIDDPQLYVAAMYFLNHAKLSMQSPSVSNNAIDIQRALQRQINVNDADFNVLLDEASRFTSSIQSSSGKSLMQTTRAIQIQNTQARLARSLTSTGNAAFRNFVNTFIRGGLRAYQVKVGQ